MVSPSRGPSHVAVRQPARRASWPILFLDIWFCLGGIMKASSRKGLAKEQSPASSKNLEICIFSLHYPPEPTGNAPYSGALATGLAAAGYQVTPMWGTPIIPNGGYTTATGAGEELKASTALRSSAGCTMCPNHLVAYGGWCRSLALVSGFSSRTGDRPELSSRSHRRCFPQPWPLFVCGSHLGDHA